MRLCKDCKHLGREPKIVPGVGYIEDGKLSTICERPVKEFSWVWGEQFQKRMVGVEVERGGDFGDNCGRDAKFFEPLDTPPTPR